MTLEAGPSAPTIPGPVRDTRKPRLQMPPGACDCHAHIFGPQGRYPYAARRRYTPPDAPLDDYLHVLHAVGVERAVLVQPSVYLTDNSALLDALALRKFPLHGVVVVNDDVSDGELERMHELGVRGVRLNLRFNNGVPAAIAPHLAQRGAPLGWHLQFRLNSEDFIGVEPMIEKFAVPVVIDHMGQVPVAEGVGGTAFDIILRLARSGRCWVKLSAPMRMSRHEYPYDDVMPFVHALLEAAPQRLVWATDWPHTTITKKMPNDADLVDLLGCVDSRRAAAARGARRQSGTAVRVLKSEGSP